MSKIVIYDTIDFERQSLEYYEDNIFLRELRKRIKSLWKIKKSSIDWDDNYEKKHNKDDTRQHIQNVDKFNNISK